ncbi:BLUF domain-containing protein [Pseudomaricurvus sp. HS19]|uniref:BLUF domain-containing protein n=1 Tax=Pseudomaricurvus sp. HS19 TaxID=2692626 RepID=UPI00136A05B6|nr:BLUF domain-containing protein [Pseudomaricurvus sp. HS19]MYM63341.1 hypothetical protein [Pseudomaricurvus sp. HS19]
MRRIACIGKLSSSNRSQLCEQVLDIFNRSRIFNSSKQIQGIFLVQEDIIFQILEGHQDTIGEAIYKARRDYQIETLTIIANYRCEKPVFSGWNMRYIRPGGHTTPAHLERIKTELEPHLKTDQPAATALFHTIFTPSPAIVTAPAETLPAATREVTADAVDTGTDTERLHTHLLSIRAWPKASQVKLSSQVMKACALMSKGKISYQELFRHCLWRSEAELTEFLSQLNHIGVLVFAPMEAAASSSEATETEPVQTSSGDRFGALMRKFLTNTRLRVS